MPYTSENLYKALNSAENLAHTILYEGRQPVHHNFQRKDGHYVSEGDTNVIAMLGGTTSINTGNSDDFVFINSGSGSIDLGGGTNFADIGSGSFTFYVNDETETTTLLDFDSANDKLRYHGGDRDAFEDAVVEGAVQFKRGESDDLLIEFNNTTILLEDFSGDLSRFVKTAAGEEAWFDFSSEYYVDATEDFTPISLNDLI